MMMHRNSVTSLPLHMYFLAQASPCRASIAQHFFHRRFVLRNWIAQQAIEKAEKGDYSAVNEVLELLRDPYRQDDAAGAALATSTQSQVDAKRSANQEAAAEGAVCRFDGKPPAWARDLCVTCSS